MKSIIEKTRRLVTNKQFIALTLIMLVMITPTFAADTIEALDDWGNKILELFGGTWMKVICLVALIVEAIGMVVAGQQGGGGAVIKKFAPWIIGTIILLSASGICSYFLKDLKFEITTVNQTNTEVMIEPLMVNA